MAVVEEPLDRVGDLELVARRRRDRAHRLVDQRREQVDADEREVGRRVGRLLDEAHDVAVHVELGDAEVARVLHVREQDLRGGRRPASSPSSGGRSRASRKRSTNVAQVVLEHVVAEVHDEVVVAEEVAGDEHAVREAARRVLVDVGDLDAELGAVADRGPDLVAGVADGDDDADLLDPGRGELLDAVEDDRLVRDRHELLRARVRDRAKPRAGAAGEDQALHPRRK